MSQPVDHNNEQAGKKYFVTIEGTEHPWDRDTITVQEIRTLGNLPIDQAVVEVSPEGTERTLRDTDTIVLKPGHHFGRAPIYRRGK